MYLEPYSTLLWAYRLHYYICFRTYKRRHLFATADRSDYVSEVLREIGLNHRYHFLNLKPYPDHLRCLISLQPGQSVSKVVEVLKSNSSRQLGSRYGITPPVWARGFLAHGLGRVQIEGVRQYVASQPEHHGYAARKLPPVFRYRAEEPLDLRGDHSSFELNYHVVLATSYRTG